MNFKISSRSTGNSMIATLTVLKGLIRDLRLSDGKEVTLKNTFHIEGSTSYFDTRPCCLEIKTYHSDKEKGIYYTSEAFNVIMVD